MSILRTRPRLAAGALALAGLAAFAILLAANPSTSAAGGGPASTHIRATGQVTFQENGFFRDGQHYSPQVSAVMSGGRLVVTNRTDEDHTFSLVRRSQIPHTLGQAFGCYGPQGACNQTLNNHGFNDDNPANDEPSVDKGRPGFDRTGDSFVFAKGKTVRRIVSASSAQNLYFMCVFHPQMSGRIGVR